MILHPVLDQLRALKLEGMLEALREQKNQKDVKQLSFEERLGLLIEHEISLRESRRVKRRLQAAKLKTPACFEDINFKVARRLDKSVVLSLENCQWVKLDGQLFFCLTGPYGCVSWCESICRQ